MFSRPQALVYDYHFASMNTFRVIGYVLYTSMAYPCPALWNPGNPLEWTYGPFDNTMCRPLANRTSR